MNKKILPTQAKAIATDVLEEIEVYMQQKKYYQALEAMEKLFEINQFDNELIYKKAYLHFLVGEYDKAYHWLRVFSDNQGPDYRVYILNGEIQLKIGRKDEAIKILINFFEAFKQGYFTIPSQAGYEQLDNLIEKLKKSYKWSKLLRMCPELKNYDGQRRKALKQMEKNSSEVKPETTVEVKDEVEVTKEEVEGKDLTLAVGKELAPVPNKDIALNGNKELAVNSAKEVAASPVKHVVTPMEKLVAEYKEKKPELDDEFRKLSYEEIFNLIKELWAKGRLSEKQQRLLVRQDVEAIKGAIDAQILALKKKIWLFSYVANLFRQRILFEEAIYLLRAALKYDDEDTVLLKNLGYTLLSNGETKVAMEVLEDTKLKDLAHQDMDYAVLDLITQCR